MNPIYTAPVSAQEMLDLHRLPHRHMVRYFDKYFIENKHFENEILPLQIRRISLIVAYSVKVHLYNKNHQKQLLRAIFDHLKKCPNESIQKNTDKVMCEINNCVELYLETDFNPQIQYSQTKADGKNITSVSHKKKTTKKTSQKRVKHWQGIGITRDVSPVNNFTSTYRTQLRLANLIQDDYEYGLSDID